MEVNLLKSDSKIKGVKAAFNMGVDTSGGHITHFLRNTLYSNKIAAICREIGSNSLDANVESGKANVPVVISISQEESILGNGITISFKDSGIGMNEERMGVYSQYAASTKRVTNSQKGGFGLGAKTPFAYTDNYMIETVSVDAAGEKRKWVYLATLSGDGISEESQILLISDDKSDEETGTTITIPIEEKNIADFEFESYKMSHLWEVQPTFVGFKTRSPEKELIYSGSGYRVFKKNSILKDNHMCSVDGIVYPISTEEVKGFRKVDGHFCIVFDFATGEVKMNVSRELLEYSENTITKITDRYVEFKKELTKEVYDYYNNASSYADAWVRASRLNTFGRYDCDDDIYENQKEGKTKLLYFISQFNRHVLQFKADVYKDQKLIVDREFRWLKIEKISKNSFEPNGIKRTPITLICLDLFTLPIYENKPNRRKNVKRELALLENNNEAIVICHPKDKDFEKGDKYSYYSSAERNKEKYHEELKDLKVSGIEMIDLQTIKPLKINLGSNGSIMEKGSVEVAFRSMKLDTNFYNKCHVEFDKENEELLLSEDHIFNNTDKIVLIELEDLRMMENAKDRILYKKHFINQFMKHAKNKFSVLFLFVNKKKVPYFAELELTTIDKIFDEFIKDEGVIKILRKCELKSKQIEHEVDKNMLKFLLENNLFPKFNKEITSLLKKAEKEKEEESLYEQKKAISEIFAYGRLTEEQKIELNKITEDIKFDDFNYSKIQKLLTKYPIIERIEGLLPTRWNNDEEESLLTKQLIESLKDFINKSEKNKI